MMRLRLVPAVFAVFATSMAVGAFDGATPPFVALMNQGDLVYDASSTTAVFIAPANFTTYNLQLNQFLISRGRPGPFPTALVLKEGHAIYMATGSKVQARDPQLTAPDGTVVWLSYGQITLANVSTGLLGGNGLPRTPSRVIIKTQAVTTGAKGTLVQVAYDTGTNQATVMNHDADPNECLLYPGITTTGTPTPLAVGSYSVTVTGNPIGLPIPIAMPIGIAGHVK